MIKKIICTVLSLNIVPPHMFSLIKNDSKTLIPKGPAKLIHYNKLDKGGHFAAWEQPQLFVEEMRASFKSLRQPT